MRPPRLDEDEGAPEWWRRAKGLRAAPIVLVIVLVAILLHAAQGTPPPPLRTSCTTPAIALSEHSVEQHRAVRWSATGPAGMRFLLALGVARFDVDASGALNAVPEPGLTRARTQAVSTQQAMPQQCKTDNTFGVVVPPGSYTVRMFRLNAARAAPSATPVATARLTVTKANR